MKNTFRTSVVLAAAMVLSFTPVKAQETRNVLPNASAGQVQVLNIGQTTDGSMGRLTIGSYSAKLYNGSSQAIVDAADSAAYMPWGSKVFIADHASQGFRIIRTLNPGATAEISDNAGTTSLTMASSYQGTNTGNGINLNDGRYAENVSDGNYVLYTCNDSTGVSVTVTYWNTTADQTQRQQGIEGFVTRMYTTCLGRNAESGGFQYWTNRLSNRIIGGSDVADGFFFSAEFLNDNFSNEEYVNRLYLTIMGRNYDQDGFNYWVSSLQNGRSRYSVLQGFMYSQEWTDICTSYSINR